MSGTNISQGCCHVLPFEIGAFVVVHFVPFEHLWVQNVWFLHPHNKKKIVLQYTVIIWIIIWIPLYFQWKLLAWVCTKKQKWTKANHRKSQSKIPHVTIKPHPHLTWTGAWPRAKTRIIFYWLGCIYIEVWLIVQELCYVGIKRTVVTPWPRPLRNQEGWGRLDTAFSFGTGTNWWKR